MNWIAAAAMSQIYCGYQGREEDLLFSPFYICKHGQV